MKQIYKIVLVVIGIVIASIITVTSLYITDRGGITSTEEHLSIVTTFYPLYEFTSSIVRDKAEVELLVPEGVEVHDWEPTAKDIERVKAFDLLIYTDRSLEPYVEGFEIDSVETSKGLVRDNDPHIWLDPLLAKEQIVVIRDAIISMDAANEAYYRRNAEEYMKGLDQLHNEYSNGLMDCERREFIVFHSAYQYLADRYDLEQIPLISTELKMDDLTVDKMREVIDIAKEKSVRYMYAEKHLDERLIRTLAEEVGATILILNPIEVYDGESYMDGMKRNLENLRIGLGCR